MKVTTKISGFGYWEQAFTRLAATATSQILSASLRRAAYETVEIVKDHAPVGDPPYHLRDTIVWAATDENVGGTISEVAILGNQAAVHIAVLAPYARYVEFGTSRMPAQPFLRPGIAAAEPVIAAALEQEIWDQIWDILQIVVLGPPKLISVVVFDVLPAAWNAIDYYSD